MGAMADHTSAQVAVYKITRIQMVLALRLRRAVGFASIFRPFIQRQDSPTPIFKTTPVGFEPTRGDPIGLPGRRLNRSAKVSLPSSQMNNPSFSPHSAHHSYHHVSQTCREITRAWLRLQQPRRQMTPVGFEPTPLRNGALSHRLRPLGQSVLEG